MPDVDDDVLAPSSPFWSGTITFGLVSVPVNLHPANRSSPTSLRMLSPDGTPLNRRYFAARGKRSLEAKDIVRGYEIKKDRYVVVEDEELERLAPERTRDIDLRVFVDASSIDPIHFERGYYLTPAGSTKAYRLLAQVMEDTGRAGIATFVMRGKEYLVAILAENGILRGETLRFADEIRDAAAIGLPEPRRPRAADINRMARAIGKLSKTKLAPSELQDQAAQRMQKLVQKKVKARHDVVRYDPELDRESGEVIDLMEMLRRSLATGDGSLNGASTKGAGKLEARTKEELSQRASELDVPGRSTMTKKELIEAIRKQG